MPWTIHPDGSFDLLSPNGALRGCWPAWDHVPLRPLRVEVGADTITWHLPRGLVRIRLGSGPEGATLDCRLEGTGRTPRWFASVGAAVVEGFTHCYRQGMGFSGPAGCLAFADLGKEWHQPSHLTLGLFTADEATTTITVHQHRDWLFRADLRQSAWRHNFRNREIDETTRTCELGFRTECVDPGAGIDLPTIQVAQGQGVFATLCRAMEGVATANGARSAFMGSTQSAPCYHWCSWYDRTEHLNQDLFTRFLDGLKTADPQRRIQTLQIDDATCPSHGDWLDPTANWPQTMEPVMRAITDRGYRAGIWIAPFMVGSESRLAAEHPDWLLHDHEGRRLVEWRHYDGHKRDREHYVLDTSHPDALAWIREVFATYRRWGARFFKTDFMEWGYKDSTRVRRHTPGKTGAQYYDEVLRTIREAIGPDSHWLGCICYFAPHIGYCDSMRVSSDVGVRWDGHGGTGNDGVGGGTQNMIEESFATLFQNHVLWQCDPDVVFVRDRYILHSETEFRSLACWHGLLGHSINTSDPFPELSAERLTWWRWLRPQAEPWTAALPYYATGHTFRVAVRDYPQANGWAVLLLNDGKERRLGRCALRDLIGRDRAQAFRWSPQGAEPLGEVSDLIADLDRHESDLIYLSRDGQPPPAGMTFGGAFD